MVCTLDSGGFRHCSGNGMTQEALKVKVARLQSEFCTKDFFRATNFVTKNAPKFSPKFLRAFVKKTRKIPSKFPTKFPCKKNQKIHRRASAGAQRELCDQSAATPRLILRSPTPYSLLFPFHSMPSLCLCHYLCFHYFIGPNVGLL